MKNILELKISKITSLYLIIIILIIAAVLRFWGISEKGFWNWDEAYYANIAKAPYYVLQAWLDNPDDVPVRQYLLNRGVNGTPFLKPGHIFFMALSFFIFGVNDYSLLIMMGIFGTFLIFLIYKFGEKYFSVFIGLAAALIAAVSGHLVYYSRSAFPQMDTVVFSLLSLLCFLTALKDPERKKKYLWLSGGFFSVGVLMHQALAVPMIILIIYFTWFTWNEKKGIRHVVGSLVPLTLPSLTLYGMVMASSKIFFSLFPQFIPRTTTQVTLGDRTVSRLTTIFQSYSFNTSETLTVLKMFITFEGIIVFILILYGSYEMYNNRKRFTSGLPSLILIQFWVVVLYWSFFSGGHPTGKAFMIIMPQMSLIAGVGFVFLIKRIPSMRASSIFGALLAAVIILSSIYNILPLLTYSSGYKKVVEMSVKYAIENDLTLTREQEGITPLLAFYIGEEYDKGDSAAKKHIDASSLEMGDLIIIDYHIYDKPEKNRNVVRAVKNLSPKFSVDNRWVSLMPKFHTHYGEIFNIRNNNILKHEDATKILVYDISVNREKIPADNNLDTD